MTGLIFQTVSDQRPWQSDQRPWQSDQRPWQSDQSQEQMFKLPQSRPFLYPDARPIAYNKPGFRPLEKPGEFKLVDPRDERPQFILSPSQANQGLKPGSIVYQPPASAFSSNLKVMEKFDNDFLQANQDVLEIFKKYGQTPKFYVYNRPQANTYYKKSPNFLGLLYKPVESKGTPGKVYRFSTGNEQGDGSRTVLIPEISKTYNRGLGTDFRTGQILPSDHQGILNSESVIFPDNFPITFPDTVPRALTVPSINSQASQEYYF